MPKALLLILDGWGYRKEKRGNAIALAKTPVMDKLWKSHPHTLLKAAGPAVGLPAGFIGNSEVGHLTLGAGRVIDSDMIRINKAIKDGSFFRNKVLLETIRHAKQRKEKLHFMGLLSDAGVHSHIQHLFALLELAKREGVKEVYVHAFLDGRDTPPKSAAKHITLLQHKMRQLGIGTLATMMGRYYAMDRDNRWNREHKAYDCMVNCIGRKIHDPLKALQDAYSRGETDEFICPTVIKKDGKPLATIKDNDVIFFFNLRSDRARQITKVFVQPRFEKENNGDVFKRKRIPKNIVNKFAQIYLIDDSSKDETIEADIASAKSLNHNNFKVMKTPFNQGYGGNQKIGYHYAIKQGFDYVIMLHGDGQYPPEFLPNIIECFADSQVAAVFGSRMMKEHIYNILVNACDEIEEAQENQFVISKITFKPSI